MYGDLSWITKSLAASLLNYIIGFAGCAVAFLYLRRSAISSSGDEAFVMAAMPGALVAAAYLVLWRVLVLFVDRIELEAPDPQLFMRGVVAFLCGVLTFSVPFLVLRAL